MKKSLLVLFVVCCVVGCGQTDEVVPRRIVQAEKMMSRHEYGAYELLTEMRPNVNTLSKELQMRYWIDYLDAKNKDVYHLDIEDIPHAQQVLDYYQMISNEEETARACYLLGCARRDVGQKSESIEAWLKGTSITGGAARIKALIYEQLTDSHYYRYLFDEAKAYNDSALYYSRVAGDSSILTDVMVDRCALFYIKQMYDSVLLYTDDISKFYAARGDGFRAANAVINAVLIYNERKDWQNAAHYLTFYEQQCGLLDETGNIKSGNELYYYMKGECLLNKGELDSAVSFFRKELSVASDWNNRQAACKGISEYFESVGCLDSALHYVRLQVLASDSAYSEQNNYQLQQLQEQYNENYYRERVRKREKETEEHQKLNLKVTIYALVTLFLLLISFLWWRNRMKLKVVRTSEMVAKKEARIAKLSQQLDKMILDQEITQSQVDASRKKIEELTNELIAQTKEKDEQMRIRRESFSMSEEVVCLKQKAYKGGVATLKEWHDLRASFQEVNPQFIQNIMQLLPSITDDEIIVCMCYQLRFSNKSISILLAKQPSAISNIRNRLFEKVNGRKGTAEESVLRWKKLTH